jgi:hypothetical protein
MPVVAGGLRFAIFREAVKQLDEFLRILVGQQLRGIEMTLQDIQRIALLVSGRFIFAHGWGPLCRHGIVLGIEEQERNGFCESPVVGTIG